MMPLTLLTGLVSMWALGAADQPEPAQEGPDYAAFSVSRLRCAIGNNNALGEHRAWYNGIFNLTAPDQPESAFVPAYAGFNLEHYFDARPRHEDRAILFEPRSAPMEFRRVNETTAELHQPSTPHFGVESWTRFELKEPYYIDVTFRCVPRKGGLEGNFFGMFWASYMNGPADKGLYFLKAGSTLDSPQWVQFCTQQHHHFSTVLRGDDPNATSFQDGPPMLWNQISPLRYSAPFFYGQVRNMALIYIFEPGANIRFSHSPSGGGATKAGDDTNPAWDFQFIVPDWRVNQEYGFKARVVYKPWAGRADVLAEVRKFP